MSQQKNKKALQNLPVFKPLSDWYQVATLPFLEGIPIRLIVIQFFEELKKDKIGPRASAIAFNFMLALFPTLIFLFSLIPVIPIDGLQETIFELLERILPEDAFELFRNTIAETISEKRVDLLSFGFLASIIFTTNGVNAILKTFDKSNAEFKRRNYFKEWTVALMLTIFLSSLVIIGLGLIVAGSQLIDLILVTLKQDKSITLTFFFLSALRWIIIIGIYFFGLSIIYYFGPAMHRKWKFISVGATVATFLSVISTVGFSFYVNNFGQYNRFYGSLGTFLIIMIWLYINALVLLFGFELNNSIRLRKMINSKED